VRFEELDEFGRGLLVDAFRDQLAQRLRALIGVPVCVAVAALAYAYFIAGDDLGGGKVLGWPVVLAMAGISCWMLAETLANRRVRWALRGLGLDESEEEILAAMKAAGLLSTGRAQARAVIRDELNEGTRRAALVARRGWWAAWQDDESRRGR
jgi:hypothetical protein